MGFSLSFSLFFIVSVFYIVIVDVFTMLFRISGLTEEKARFQVISLLTNSGYSTKESELVVDVLPRRKLARVIMLFGYVFSITIVSVFVNMMMSLPASEKEDVLPALIIVSTLFVIFLFVRRIPVVKSAVNSILEQWGRKLLYGDQGNTIIIRDEYPSGMLVSVTLNAVPPALKDKTLSQMDALSKEKVHIFCIVRDGTAIVDDLPDEKLQLHDSLRVFGPIKGIRSIFQYEPPQENEIAEAARPETEQEYVHQEEVQAAEEAAREARQTAHEEQIAAQKEAQAAQAIAEGKKPHPSVLTEIKDALGNVGTHAEQPDESAALPETAARAQPDSGAEKGAAATAESAEPVKKDAAQTEKAARAATKPDNSGKEDVAPAKDAAPKGGEDAKD